MKNREEETDYEEIEQLRAKRRLPMPGDRLSPEREASMRHLYAGGYNQACEDVTALLVELTSTRRELDALRAENRELTAQRDILAEAVGKIEAHSAVQCTLANRSHDLMTLQLVFELAHNARKQPAIAEALAADQELRDAAAEIQEYVAALPATAKNETGLVLVSGKSITIGKLRSLVAAAALKWGTK